MIHQAKKMIGAKAPLVALVTILAAGLAGCAGGAGGAASVDCPAFEDVEHADMVHIEIKDMAYSPASASVRAGQWILWTNAEPIGHTVTPFSAAKWGTPGSGSAPDEYLMDGETWAWCFSSPGTYEYYCVPHATKSGDRYVGMVAKVIVS